MTTVYFIRHAEPDYSIQEDAIRPLTQDGLLAAQALVETFKDVAIDHAYSSPYKRAIDTIGPLAQSKDLAIECIKDFRERKIQGDGWIDDFKAYSRQQWNDFDFHLPGGESLQMVQERNIRALKAIVSKSPHKTIIIGSHGTALSTIINYYDSNFGYEDFNDIRHLMPWIVRMDIEADQVLHIDTKLYRS